MKLTAQQAAQFQRDGFLVFPQLFSQAEIDVLRAEALGQQLIHWAERNPADIVGEPPPLKQ